MPSLFDTLVLRRPKRGNKVEIRPLWKLKISDSEFDELRSFLLTGVKIKCPDWFLKYPRECLLFFSEYWKRYFNGGKHSVRDVLRCLSENLEQEYERAFYKAARNGGSLLKIEVYEGEGDRHRTLDSILYQGGLPMRLICQSDGDGFQNWKAFAKRLIRGYIDLSHDELGLGQAATNLKSIRQFAERIYLGLATNDAEAMPFYCSNSNHPWFKALMELKESERKKNQECNPFSIDWVIELDDRKHRGRVLG
ncbi:MAG: hypothetical protein K2H76_06540, partial [Muribaculaceae bacterium]|nr:hypothetical protein [Muribaculaceae bacterium]